MMNFFLVIQIIFSELFQITVKTLYWPKFLPRRRNFKRTCQNADVPLFKNYTLFLVFFGPQLFIVVYFVSLTNPMRMNMVMNILPHVVLGKMSP